MGCGFVQQAEVESAINFLQDHEKLIKCTLACCLLLVSAAAEGAANAAPIESDERSSGFQIVRRDVQAAGDTPGLNVVKQLTDTNMASQDDLASEQIFLEGDVAAVAPLIPLKAIWVR